MVPRLPLFLLMVLFLAVPFACVKTYTLGPISAATPTPTAVVIPTSTPTVVGSVSILAGQTGIAGSANGIGTAASFDGPAGIAVDASGNLYVADEVNCLIRKITSGGVVTTLAGSGTPGFTNATGTAASFYYPTGVAVDSGGNVYVGDTENQVIRKITPGGVVSTFAGSGLGGSADGTGTAASFNGPSGIAIDSSGNLYVSDVYNNLIRKITPGGGVTTLAGTGSPGSANGTGTSASFNAPWDVAVDPLGNLYVADANNGLIRKINTLALVSTLAGSGTEGFANGTGTAASFAYPAGVAVEASGNILVADQGNDLIREITPAGVVTTLAGQPGVEGSANGTGPAATFFYPWGIVVSGSGKIYVTDYENELIREIQ